MSLHTDEAEATVPLTTMTGAEEVGSEGAVRRVKVGLGVWTSVDRYVVSAFD
jgi:hypothetical protein